MFPCCVYEVRVGVVMQKQCVVFGAVADGEKKENSLPPLPIIVYRRVRWKDPKVTSLGIDADRAAAAM